MIDYYEILGYVGMILILISVSVDNMRTFRFFNITGCLAFIIYGFHHGTMPSIILNILIVLINIYQLSKK
jgi:hypothetical protein